MTGVAVVVVHAFDRTDRADLLLEKDLTRARRNARYRTQSWVVEVLSDLHVEVPVIVSTPDGTVEDTLAEAAQHARMVVVGAAEGRRYRDLATALAARVRLPRDHRDRRPRRPAGAVRCRSVRRPRHGSTTTSRRSSARVLARSGAAGSWATTVGETLGFTVPVPVVLLALDPPPLAFLAVTVAAGGG